MSKPSHGGYQNTGGAKRGRSLAENLSQTIREFPISGEGLFGTPGNNSGVRHITSQDPVSTSIRFFGLLTEGGDVLTHVPGKIVVKRTSDDAFITWRPVSSSDGTPAVDINVSKVVHGFVHSHKIHFEKGNQ